MDTPNELETSAKLAIDRATSLAELRVVEAQYLGKSGSILALMKQLGILPKEDKPAFGKEVNRIRDEVQALIEAREPELKEREQAARFAAEAIDVTMPGAPPRMGLEHIIQLTGNRIKRVLGGLGFEYRESPELELVDYNYTALNYPPDHPAMDDQDTFYIDDQYLLRSQGTALQGHVFESTPPPLRCFTIARCYRNEAVDRTHNHTFHQVDCFMIDEGISMANLKGTLRMFAQAMFGGEATVRFRPDFFPFVEPGVDYAISTPKLFGGQWVELGGAGLIHPNILENYNIDPERYSGFAFGLGVERIPMMAYGIDDLRLFLENDLRFLEQFRGEAMAGT